jgi:hypothetical protein
MKKRRKSKENIKDKVKNLFKSSLLNIYSHKKMILFLSDTLINSIE